MSVTPSDVFQVAVELCRSPAAARRRTAVSRAYYALYHAVAELLRDVVGLHLPESSGGHGEVRTRLLNSGDAELHQVATGLADWHSLRISADYRLHQEDGELPTLVLGAVKKAGDLLDYVESCYHEPRRSEVVKALKR